MPTAVLDLDRGADLLRAGEGSVAPTAERDRLFAGLQQSLGDTLCLMGRRLDALLADVDSMAAQRRLRELRHDTVQALRILAAVGEASDLLRYRNARVDRALRGLGSEFAQVSGVVVEVRVREPFVDLPDVLRLLLLRVARQALFDLARHGRATVASLTLSGGPTRVVLEMADDGVDLASRPVGDWRPSPELVLVPLARRMAAAGGRLAVLQGRPRGLRLRAVVPVPTSSGDAP